jgi:predicted transcriptional regulator
MTNATKPPNKKLPGFPGSRDSVETKLLSWIRGIVQRSIYDDHIMCFRQGSQFQILLKFYAK